MKNKIKRILNRILIIFIKPIAFVYAVVSVLIEEYKYGNR